MSFWQNQNQIAMGELMNSAGRLAAALREKRDAESAQREYRAGYAKALASAKQTGVMPEQYQQLIPIDLMTSQVGVKVVALRELGKLNPKHALVVSPAVRENIATQTLVNYNLADRPEGANLNDFAPSESQTEQIINFTLKR